MIQYPRDNDKKIKVLECMSNLEHSEAFKVVFDWLSEEAVRIGKEYSSIKEETALRWSQGQCQMLWDFLSKATTARDTLEKLRDNSPSKDRP